MGIFAAAACMFGISSFNKHCTILIIPAPLAARPYNYDYTSTRREKCMEYLRYDVVQPAKEPHIKSTGVRKNENARENPTIYGR